MKWLIISTPNIKSRSRIVLGSRCLDAKTLTLLASYLSPIREFVFLDNYHPLVTELCSSKPYNSF